MLNLISVKNITFNEVDETCYDFAFFASGYESRCTLLAKKIGFKKISHSLVFGFSEHRNDKIRKANDDFFSNNNLKIFEIGKNAELDIFTILKTLNFVEYPTLKILIDYSSMSRLWYSSILNFIRFQNNKNIEVFLNYSLGQYDKSFIDYSYSSINSLPSLEGTLSSNNKTLLVLAIGFSPYLVKSVIEEIEPNDIIGILPIPNFIKKYEKKSIQIKEDILTKDIDYWVNCPINDLESIFRTYAEITSGNINQKDIIFLSLGPKIYTLASILVSQRFKQVTCLYLKSSNSLKVDVKATGDTINNKVYYKMVSEDS